MLELEKTNIKKYSDLKNHNFEKNPKVVFRTGNEKLEDLPTEIIELYKEQMQNNQEYTLFYFSNSDRKNFIESLNDERTTNAYNKIIPESWKTDLFRYCIIYKYGGIYMDFSMSAFVRYDDIIKDYKQVLVKDYEDYGLLAGFIYGQKNDILFDTARRYCVENAENEDYCESSLAVTGPTLLGKAYKDVNNIPRNELIKVGEIDDRLILKYIDDKYVIDGNSNILIQSRHNNHYLLMYKTQIVDLGGIHRPITHYHSLWMKRIGFKDERYFQIEKIYTDVLERDGDIEGLVTYHTSGKSIDEIRNEILNSGEYHKIQEYKKSKKIKELLGGEKIPILMPMYNRPDYLNQTLIALKDCDNIKNFFIITFEEPNEECSEIVDNIDFIEVIRNKNEERLGCNRNFAKLFETALNLEKFILLEDDIVPQKDFLNYFLWAFKELENDENVKIIGAYSRANGEPNKVELSKEFCPWGWGSWGKKMKNIIDFTFQEATSSWDCYLNEYMINNNFYSVKPILSRVQNIGEVGTFVPSAEWQKENQRTKYTINDLNIEPITKFTL